MANTSDLLIITFVSDQGAIRNINRKTGLDFKRVTDSSRCGGCKFLSFTAYGTSLRCIGEEALADLIAVFHKTHFGYPEWAVLFISDDDSEEHSGIFPRKEAVALVDLVPEETSP